MAEPEDVVAEGALLATRAGTRALGATPRSATGHPPAAGDLRRRLELFVAACVPDAPEIGVADPPAPLNVLARLARRRTAHLSPTAAMASTDGQAHPPSRDARRCRLATRSSRATNCLRSSRPCGRRAEPSRQLPPSADAIDPRPIPPCRSRRDRRGDRRPVAAPRSRASGGATRGSGADARRSLGHRSRSWRWRHCSTPCSLPSPPPRRHRSWSRRRPKSRFDGRRGRTDSFFGSRVPIAASLPSRSGDRHRP